MPEFLTTNDQTQVLIPLRIKPYLHETMHSVTGSVFSHEAGTVLYGCYIMEYLLPRGDRLRLIANHNKKNVQLMLFTHDPEILKFLPGKRASSLVADTINSINRYCIQSASYKQPLNLPQQQKIQQAHSSITLLTELLKQERALKRQDHHGQEQLRRQVLSIVEQCNDGNRMIANNPIVSEGSLGKILYDAHKAAQHYQFNRVYPVSQQDQMDFTHIEPQAKQNGPACFIWDSEVHIEYNSNDLDDALRVICQHYALIPANNLKNTPANRFEQLEAFIRKLWSDGQDWMNYLSFNTKPTHKTEILTRANGVSLTKITPYYRFKGTPQKGYSTLNELVFNLTKSTCVPKRAKTTSDAQKILEQLPDGNWVIIPSKQQTILKLNNKLITCNYFIKDSQFYPLPEGNDLYALSQVSKRHLYFPERFSLKFKAFISRIPSLFTHFYNGLSQFITHDLHQDFLHHVHENHVESATEDTIKISKPQPTESVKNSLYLALEKNGFLTNGKTIEEFIKEQLSHSHYVIARANHPPSPPTYINPLHRTLGVLRHIGGFFIDTCERNPIVGTLAMAAYLYGAGAVLAPVKLANLLTKLHLNGLISGIEPIQKLAQLMNHGTISEAISASITCWQAMVVSGNLDSFFVSAVSALKDDPAEIAIIASLALSLGYGLTKAIPSLQHEMGTFPYTNYAALGGKSGAAIYDTVMHPGDDWLLGTCKWLCKGALNLAKLAVAPFFEGYHYGFSEGFISGWSKSAILVKRLNKQLMAASIDFLLALSTIPLLELSALFIHLPFRGITNLCRKILATLGNISVIGQLLIDFANRYSLTHFISTFKLSPLYGFTSPFGVFSENKFINLSINIIRFIYLPPLQLIKNILILPLVDAISLILRLIPTIIYPPLQIGAYALGTVLYHFGTIWDNSIGLIFSETAKSLTLLCDWLNNKASDLKQTLLSHIEIKRGALYHWAFHEDDTQTHTTLNDEQYYSSNPRRCELIPHSSSHCLLHNLLTENNTHLLNKKSNPPQHHQKLFPAESPMKEPDRISPSLKLV